MLLQSARASSFCFIFYSASNYSPSLYSLSTLTLPPSTLLRPPLHTLCLKVRLVPVNFEDPQFTASYQQSAALYARYQMAIHGDDPSKCNESEVLHDYYSAPTVGTVAHTCSSFLLLVSILCRFCVFSLCFDQNKPCTDISLVTVFEDGLKE